MLLKPLEVPMKMKEVLKLRKGDVVRFKWSTSTKKIDVVQVVTKKWSESTNEYGGTEVRRCHNQLSNHLS